MISLTTRIWAARILLVAAIILLCILAGSGAPSWATAITWGPNGLFLAAFTKGVLRLPRFLERVHSIEPVIYRWLGVGLVKRIVANEVWPRVHGLTPAVMPRNREDFLNLIELSTKGAEACHGATFILASCIAAYYAYAGQASMAVWIMVFNVALNAYPVMLQRSNRWRMQQARIDIRNLASIV